MRDCGLRFAPVSWLCGLSVSTLLRHCLPTIAASSASALKNKSQWQMPVFPSRLQLRGSAGFSPASLMHARTYLNCELEINGAQFVKSTADFGSLSRNCRPSCLRVLCGQVLALVFAFDFSVSLRLCGEEALSAASRIRSSAACISACFCSIATSSASSGTRIMRE